MCVGEQVCDTWSHPKRLEGRQSQVGFCSCPGGNEVALRMTHMLHVPGRAGCSPRTWASTWPVWKTCCSCMSWWRQTSPCRLSGCGLSVPLPCASATQAKVRTWGGPGNGEVGKGNIKIWGRSLEKPGNRRVDGWIVSNRARAGRELYQCWMGGFVELSTSDFCRVQTMRPTVGIGAGGHPGAEL